MAVYATSDMHGSLPQCHAVEGDVVLLGGDICPDYRTRGAMDREGHQQALWLDTVFRGWLEPITERGVEVVAIWGNHDFVGENPGIVPELPWTLLEDDEATVGGLRVYGTAWVPGLPYWAFYADDRRLALRAEAIPAGLDVLLTHGPPYRAGDFVPTSEKQRRKYGNYGGTYVGDGTLNSALERARPRVTVCGHIHEDRGWHSSGGSDVVNVAMLDGDYRPYAQSWTRLPMSPLNDERPA